MRKGIEKRYGNKDLVAIGGTFVVHTGTITHHFRNFLEEPVPEGSKLRRIKKFYLYDFPAPENAVGTFISTKTELDLYLEHFHMFSHLNKANKGGHYVQDTTPEIVEYEGYFTPGEILHKVDQAPPFTDI
ncbi:ester hydrolase C11orf54-like [Belonocnema kinseyi]|uniref:ester hydrolase C11orf54-like n=1 Tax=Belonocnema kinseyi TaxID=2817044 RepID=UPI00143D01E8|nr:ester hydrolase C11orf54-like [Belonocnema kinseyi]